MYRTRNCFLSYCVILFLLAGAGLIQQARAQDDSVDSSSSNPEKNSYTLSGTVVNSVTGEPVNRALVQISTFQVPVYHRQGEGESNVLQPSYRQRTMLTDREGRFKFEGLAQMRTTLIARKPGFFSRQELSEGSSHDSRVDVGPNTPDVVVRLIPEAVITGHVVDANGEPLEGVLLRINSLMRANGRRQLQTLQQDQEVPQILATNEDGEFRIASLAPGTYYVAAVPYPIHDQPQFSSNPNIAYPITYYPAAAEFSEAEPIQLSAGQRVEADFTLRQVPVATLAGVITGYGRGEEADLQFLNQSGDDIALDKQFDAATGKFTARIVTAGQCTIKVDAKDNFDRLLHAQATLSAGASAKTLRLALVPAPSIPISVRIETTKLQPEPQPEGIRNVANRFEKVVSVPATVNLHPLDIGRPDLAASVEGGPSHPALVLHNVEAGKYKVEVIPNNTEDTSLYVKSIQYAGTDLLQQELTVAPGQSSTIEIVLRDDSASLSGTVQSQENEGQASVLIVPDYAPLDPKMTVADDHGDFQIEGLAPGDYKVFAFDRLDGLEYSNPDVLGEYASKAAQVSLQPNEKTSVRVGLIPRGE